jgi:hypothetical protein
MSRRRQTAFVDALIGSVEKDSNWLQLVRMRQLSVRYMGQTGTYSAMLLLLNHSDCNFGTRWASLMA